MFLQGITGSWLPTLFFWLHGWIKNGGGRQELVSQEVLSLEKDLGKRDESNVRIRGSVACW